MAGPNMEKLFIRKQELIEKISGEKNLGIQFSNALNNAVAVWSVLEAHGLCNEDEATKAAKDLIAWVRFFLTLKDEVRPEESGIGAPGEVMNQFKEGFKQGVGMTAEQAVKETERIFTPEGPKPEVPLCSEPQTKKIWVELHRLGYKDEDHLGVIIKILGLSSLRSIKDLLKIEASRVIEKLIKTEAKK